MTDRPQRQHPRQRPERAEVVRLLHEGKRNREIQALTGASATYVQNVRWREGLSRPRLTQEEVRHVLERLREGESTASIAQALRRSPRTVQLLARAHGVELTRRRRPFCSR